MLAQFYISNNQCRLPSCLGHSAKGLWTLRAQVGVLLIIVHTHCKQMSNVGTL